MNVFEAVKQSVTTRQAAEHYGIHVNRNGMACCPFHHDKTPSMKLDRRYHCFGCGADGDVIDFAAALYGLGKKEAAVQLAQDFGLSYEDWKPPGKAKIRSFLARKQIEISLKRYFVDAMGAMAFGLFASLLIGTIFDAIADQTGWAFLAQASEFCSAATGPAMAVAIGYALQAPSLVLFCLCAVGAAANSLGGPLGTLFAAIVAAELGKAVSKETKVDILVTPTVTILFGCAVAALVGPGVSAIMYGFGALVMRATEMQPFFMGILVSVIVGMVLTLPISSAALCTMLVLFFLSLKY